MKQIGTIMILAMALVCTSSRITSEWNVKDITPGNYEKILVVGLVKETERQLRQDMESHVVGDLKTLGYTAVSAFEQYGPKAFEDMSEESALAKIAESGVDAVMTIVLLDKGQEKEYVPARVYYSPYIVYQSRFWGYYTTMRTRVYQPGYYQENTNYFWESNFYSLRDGKKLLYSVQTKSFNPGSASTLAHEYGRLIVNDMVKHHVIAGSGKALAAK